MTGLKNITTKEDAEDDSKEEENLRKSKRMYKTWPDKARAASEGRVENSNQPSSSSLVTLFHPVITTCDDTLNDSKNAVTDTEHTLEEEKEALDEKKPRGTVGMTSMATALDNLSMSYSPVTRKLHAVEETKDTDDDTDKSSNKVSSDENQQKTEEQSVDTAIRYVPGHRKAFSLPRTLEIVDEHGAILESKVESLVESPRTTLQRYGLSYKPYDFDGESINSSGVSGISGLTDYSEKNFHSENSSHGDSGIFTESDSGTLMKQTRKGITEFLSKGLGTGWKSLSKSGQQMVKLMKKDVQPGDLSDTTPPTTPTTSLIMEQRPEGLPAKQKGEEEKHKTEHKLLIDQVKKKERTESRERARRVAEQRRNEDDLSSLTSHWANTVLPGWEDGAGASKKTQALWWRGLPPPVRGRVWLKALNNQLNLTPQLYNILVTRAKNQLLATSSSTAESLTLSSSDSREETIDLIKLDVSRTFPQLGIFQTGGPYYQLLHNVLGAFVCYRPDIGYVQGMSFLAAVLILNLEEAEAFIMFANLINRPVLSAFYSVNQQLMSQNYSSFSNLFSAHLPQLAAHFNRLGLRPDLYMLDWVMTLFSKAAPLDVACRIWDLLIRDGECFLFRAAVGVLSLYEDRLLVETDFVMLAQFLARLPDTMDCDLLFEKIEEVQPSRNQVVHQIIAMVNK